ncbi:SPASM domain-containing protein [Roseibium sp. RKSG952]|uniref:SPASM domain-containing protein n=1 Tax=Roseibium sp. RKSG952 TaxID=2529384 RepID=UPI0012BD6691|nr:SPASM domain-containing protein [Roseibium sp. RKSG952]MTH97594.1 radical SAM protein [Roseibium sp. RKSG952]
MGSHLTLHVRLVKGCNADCSYCSSWEEDPHKRMSAGDLSTALGFLVESVFPVMGCAGPGSTVSVQYVGGEILLVPKDEMRDCVYAARDILSGVFGTVLDGAQSNLIGSERRVLELSALFGGRLGTSVDGRGGQRTVKGNPDAYRKIVAKSREALMKRRRQNPSAIFVVDKEGLSNVAFEVGAANEAGYSLVLRPVFQGGSDIDGASEIDLVDGLGAAFDGWVMRSSVSVEPFTHLLGRRLSETVLGSVCPFQRNCAEVSLDLEPDGTLYTCLDMADSGQFPIGNALSGEFDLKLWERLRDRKKHVDPTCRACPYFEACQGGCMSEGIHATGSIYGKTHLCPVWKRLFASCDRAIAEHGTPEVSKWLHSLKR